jgi:hypothetical protein
MQLLNHGIFGSAFPAAGIQQAAIPFESCLYLAVDHLDCISENATVGCFTTYCEQTVAASKSERKVFLWKLVARVKPKEANAAVTLAEILALLKREFEDKRARAFISADHKILDDDSPLRNEKSQLYIADIRQNEAEKTATILFNRGDPLATAPAFIDPVKEIVRIENPAENESLGYSAHLVISTEEKENCHRACFEKMPLVSTTLVLDALDRILSRAVSGDDQYTYVKKVKKGKGHIEEARPYFPSIIINRVPSENLINDIKNGQLSEIRLTKRVDFYRGPGADGIVKRQDQIVKISASPGTVEQITNFVSAVIEKAKAEKFETITWGLEKLPGDQTNHPTIPLDHADAMETLYVRAQRLTDFANLLESCYSTVCDDIEKKMIGVLKNETRW